MFSSLWKLVSELGFVFLICIDYNSDHPILFFILVLAFLQNYSCISIEYIIHYTFIPNQILFPKYWNLGTYFQFQAISHGTDWEKLFLLLFLDQIAI